MVDRPDVYSNIKWAIHGDDDNFIRVDQAMMFLARLESLGLSTIPLVGNGAFDAKNEHVFGTKGCHEIHSYGWYQPFFVNRAAMELMKVGFSSYGMQETCDNFHTTHDVGLGPFLWMYQPYHIRIPGIYVGNHDTHTGTVVTHKVVHGSGVDNCDNITAYGESQRYNQNILMGCGDVNELQRSHRAGDLDEKGHKMYNDNYDLWNHFKAHDENADWNLFGHYTWRNTKVTLYPNNSKMLPPGSLPEEGNKLRIKHILNSSIDKLDSEGKFKGDPVVEMYLPVLDKMNGYETTNHSRQFDIVKKWVGFKPEDCAKIV